jgi:hypothetical protein
MRPHLVAISTVILCLAQIATLRAQERVRSAAGQLEIESFRNPEAFFRLGPSEEVLIGSVGMGYTDNANLTPTNKISNLSFDQALSLDATWVISHLNQLQFNFAGQVIENFYGNGRNQLTFAIAPDSLIQFRFALSNFRIRFYDQFSYSQNPTTDPTATDTANLNNFTNTIGAVVDTDMKLGVLSFLADYTYNDQSGTNSEGQSNPTTTGTRNTVRIGSSVGFYWTPTVLYGIETTATRSSGSNSANVNNFNVGPFLRGKLSKLTELNFTAGLSLYDTSAPISPTTYYFSGVIRHQLNPNLQLILSALHDLVFTTSTDLTEETIFRVGTQINLTRFITFTTTPFVDLGNEKTGDTPGRFTQFGVEASLGWKPHKRWSAGLTYDFTRLESNVASNTYIQNSLSLRLNYAF